MKKDQLYRFLELTKLFSKPHPWHSISIGDQSPEVVKVYIELVPGDTMKYELDKDSGFLKVDRPQRFSSLCPTPYGFIPQTYCAERVGAYCMEKTGLSGIQGDQDPLDICVITERNIPHGNLLLDAIPVGGLRMIDRGEADDKIIAVMRGDALYGEVEKIEDVPDAIIERLSHYFLTYKQMPSEDRGSDTKVEITDVYGREEALEVIDRSTADYRDHFEAGKQELFEILRKGF